ncbi:hypothetical protein SCHPADRAFT_808373, partial [Schizopora paradoxa]
VPTWDGNEDTLQRWLLAVNDIAFSGPLLFSGIGRVLPTRLTGPALAWYYSLPTAKRMSIQTDWDSFRNAIAEFYMTTDWFDRQLKRMQNATFRDKDHPTESAHDYYLRKIELLQLVRNDSEPQLIMEIMESAPSWWNRVLDSKRFTSIVEFQNAIKAHDREL